LGIENKYNIFCIYINDICCESAYQKLS